MQADIALQPGRAAYPWSVPAANPYTGGAAEAIAAMVWVDERVRGALIEQVLVPGDHADKWPRLHITRDHIWADDGSQFRQLRNMNFGSGTIVQRLIDTSMWPTGRELLGSLYRVAGVCVVRVDVCGNWAQVTQAGVSIMAVPTPGTLPLVLAGAAAGWLVRRRTALRGRAA